MDGISGTVEHTETLIYMINHARRYQRNLIITLLGLKNAFDVLDHQLINSVMRYHHIPDHISSLVGSFYTNYSISIGTSHFITNPAVVGKGVLQRDSLSGLIFNMSFNTLIRTIENEKVKLLGYNYKNALSSRHWFQVKDALATATQEDNQALLNVFIKWCQWGNFKICIDKSRCYVIKKNGKQSTQFRPYSTVNNEMILAVKLNDSFAYPGKEFCYSRPRENVKCDLAKRLSDNLEKIDDLSLHPKHKINILKKFVYSKLRWDLTIFHFPETWIVQNPDNKANKYIRKWLSTPI